MSTLAIKIGADPETFVKRAGQFVSGFGLIQGTKEAPYRVDKGAVQVDGHALEFNIDPASNPDEFVANLTAVLDQLRGMVPDHEVVAEPVAQFTRKYLQSMPEEANELGCDPDYNAYTKEANPRPNGDVDFRTGGGHVHIGWAEGMDITDEGHVEAGQMLTRELDFYLGLASLFWDDNDQRREMYGKAGAYRVKPYGVEYRSLSNAWLKTPELMRWVFEATQIASQNLYEGKSIAEKYGDVAQIAIDSNDRNLAKSIIRVTLEREMGLKGWFNSIPNKVVDVEEWS